MNRLDYVLRITDRLTRWYDADNDMIPGQPRVLWADMELAQAIIKLAEIVNDLECRLLVFNKEVENE